MWFDAWVVAEVSNDRSVTATCAPAPTPTFWPLNCIHALDPIGQIRAYFNKHFLQVI